MTVHIDNTQENKKLTEFELSHYAGFTIEPGHYAIAEGPIGKHHDLRFLQIQQAEAALIITGRKKEKSPFPFVIMANIYLPSSQDEQNNATNLLAPLLESIKETGTEPEIAFIKAQADHKALATNIAAELTQSGFKAVSRCVPQDTTVTLDLHYGCLVELPANYALDQYRMNTTRSPIGSVNPESPKTSSKYWLNDHSSKGWPPTLLFSHNLRRPFQDKLWTREVPIKTSHQLSVRQEFLKLNAKI